MSATIRSVFRPNFLAPSFSLAALRTSCFSTSTQCLNTPYSSQNESGDDVILRKLKDELKAAMKSREGDVATTIRSILSDHQYAQKGSLAGAAGSSILTLIQKAIAKRRDSASQYVAAKRKDLADKEHSEVSVLERFLPAQMSQAEIKNAIDQALAKLKQTTPVEGKRLLGAVIKEVKRSVGEGRVDVKVLKEAVEKATKS